MCPCPCIDAWRTVQKFLLLVGIAVALVALLAALAFFAVGQPVLWELPDGYTGWVVVRYERPECAPVEMRGLFRVIVVARSGMACTSSRSPYGRKWTYERYEYVRQDGTRIGLPNWGPQNRVWDGFTGPTTDEAAYFVGTWEELQRSWDQAPRLRGEGPPSREP